MSEMKRELDSNQRMQELGEELLREREVRGVSLQEIVDETKISRRFLEAIEKGDQSVLPAPVFTRGFIHEYAAFLGLDADAMVDRYLAQVRHDQDMLALDELAPARIPLLPGTMWLRLLLGLLVIVAIVAAVAFFVMSGQSDQPPPDQAEVEEPAPDNAGVSEPSGEDAVSTPDADESEGATQPDE